MTRLWVNFRLERRKILARILKLTYRVIFTLRIEPKQFSPFIRYLTCHEL